MIAPRLEIRLDDIGHNTRVLVGLLAPKGIEVTAVTKALMGEPPAARRLVAARVTRLGDSRIENIVRMRAAGVTTPITLIRSPMLSQVAPVVELCEMSCNTELDVIEALAARARSIGVTHGVLLMVEMGDLREGILPEDLEGVVKMVRSLQGVRVAGIGTNLACRSGVIPTNENMTVLSDLATATEEWTDTDLGVVSGGNSANLAWALGDGPIGRINDLRIGESILLGCDPLDRAPLPGLRLDAFTLVAEVIESKYKPSAPWGERAQTAFGETHDGPDRGPVHQMILAMGRQDTDPSDLTNTEGIRIVGSSSDHVIVEADAALPIGAQVRFRPGYRALLAAMTSSYVATRYIDGSATDPSSSTVATGAHT